MCENSKERVCVSLEDLCDKIRESKETYENDSLLCNISLVHDISANPLVTNISEKCVEVAINNFKKRLKVHMGLTPPVKIIFEYIPKVEIGKSPHKMEILWEVLVNIDNLIKMDKEFMKEVEANATKVRDNMDSPIIKNLLH